MAVADLTNGATTFTDGYDSIIIPDNFQSKRGGVTLDVTGYTLPSIRAGHVIIKETATGELKPMPVTGTGAGAAYGALPGGHTYYGHAIQSVLTAKPFVGVMRRGVLNHLVVDPAAGVYNLAPILAALKTATEGRIDYIGDNE